MNTVWRCSANVVFLIFLVCTVSDVTRERWVTPTSPLTKMTRKADNSFWQYLSLAGLSKMPCRSRACWLGNTTLLAYQMLSQWAAKVGFSIAPEDSHD